jgi:hypothetical protein
VPRDHVGRLLSVKEALGILDRMERSGKALHPRGGGLQSPLLPLVSRHRMSLLPSPSKSPIPTTDQVVGMLPRPAPEETCKPFMNQIAMSPLVSRHRMSLLPSPSKSPIPTTDQVVGMLPSPPRRRDLPTVHEQNRSTRSRPRRLPGGGDSAADTLRFQQSLVFTDGGSNRSEDAIRAIHEACPGVPFNPAGLDDPRCPGNARQ